MSSSNKDAQFRFPSGIHNHEPKLCWDQMFVDPENAVSMSSNQKYTHTCKTGQMLLRSREGYRPTPTFFSAMSHPHLLTNAQVGHIDLFHAGPTSFSSLTEHHAEIALVC